MEWDDTLELEHDICELQRERDIDVFVLEQIQMSLRQVKGFEEEARKDWQYHDKNRKYVKNQADVANLEEYRGVLKLWREARLELDGAIVDVARLTASLEEARLALEESERDLARAQAVRASYGKVLTFERAA